MLYMYVYNVIIFIEAEFMAELLYNTTDLDLN